MDTTGNLGGRRGQALAIEIKPVLPPVRCPILLKGVCQLGGDTESTERQDHGANTDVRLRSFANVPTLRTPKDRGLSEYPDLQTEDIRECLRFAATRRSVGIR